MSPKQFYELMGSGKLLQAIMPPPTPIQIGEADVMAAKLLNWLHDEMPEDATQGDLDDVLDAAKWWSTFWGAAHNAATSRPTMPMNATGQPPHADQPNNK